MGGTDGTQQDHIGRRGEPRAGTADQGDNGGGARPLFASSRQNAGLPLAVAIVHKDALALPRLRPLPFIQRGEMQGHGLANVVLCAIEVHGNDAFLRTGDAGKLQCFPINAVAMTRFADRFVMLFRCQVGWQHQIASGSLVHTFD